MVVSLLSAFAPLSIAIFMKARRKDQMSILLLMTILKKHYNTHFIIFVTTFIFLLKSAQANSLSCNVQKCRN
ncbi:MAG: hypothetical protein A2600_05520 [Candidatus Lambdaproteobacteria bacterium RIFOXYD1_FULL_56_27]|uniref:Uncharacterized protein n=1 Tax=Candidatus Lambdaproteobacteria bacterium RIFOXYD2_FULL_56_26 TaxID=1817773 RepID=A0A1F6GRF7_9PROT|nr:MAG: hypothetical protein A2426_10725 [Candidatus Lambdaproteobacteria bacterium RIFOXYC1_FULL_56_13]OGH00660.1 MAG: hypothetical protein A2557_03225 [Candidatus Lambdaproteobacteria bacterium RIFOXYD2_FULL_56_26]OGH07827.1 MAG: hypothetical protein A2600_05520 [Candidatus Lambdaproteobacteria bacterium RIFOXYD1_FULL_56_27]